MSEKRGKFKFTEEVLATAQARKDEGFKHSKVAKDLGCDPDSLSVALSQRKKGLIKGQHAKKDARLAAVRKYVELGYAPSEIAKELNKKFSQVSRDLKELGLTAEERARFTPRGEVEMH